MALQQTQNICITFVQCWTSVEDVGPELYKCYILCLLGILAKIYKTGNATMWAQWWANGSDVGQLLALCLVSVGSVCVYVII